MSFSKNRSRRTSGGSIEIKIPTSTPSSCTYTTKVSSPFGRKGSGISTYFHQLLCIFTDKVFSPCGVSTPWVYRVYEKRQEDDWTKNYDELDTSVSSTPSYSDLNLLNHVISSSRVGVIRNTVVYC